MWQLVEQSNYAEAHRLALLLLGLAFAVVLAVLLIGRRLSRVTP